MGSNPRLLLIGDQPDVLKAAQAGFGQFAQEVTVIVVVLKNTGHRVMEENFNETTETIE
jgi:hypothetical protein